MFPEQKSVQISNSETAEKKQFLKESNEKWVARWSGADLTSKKVLVILWRKISFKKLDPVFFLRRK